MSESFSKRTTVKSRKRASEAPKGDTAIDTQAADAQYKEALRRGTAGSNIFDAEAMTQPNETGGNATMENEQSTKDRAHKRQRKEVTQAERDALMKNLDKCAMEFMMLLNPHGSGPGCCTLCNSKPRKRNAKVLQRTEDARQAMIEAKAAAAAAGIKDEFYGL